MFQILLKMRIPFSMCLLSVVFFAITILMPCEVATAQQKVPIQGMIGVGTWSTQAEFKDIKVTKGKETLYASDFSKGMEGWKIVSGEWKADNGVLRQTSNKEGARVLIGDTNWSNYTITLKARKLGGKEGFLILFGVPDDSTNSWWNVGGWGGTAAAFQAPFIPDKKVLGRIAEGVWIDIKLDVKGSTVRGYFNNKLVQTARRESNVFTTLAPPKDVKFSTRDVGQKKSLTRWGLDTAWPSPDNMRRGIAYMDKENVDLVRVAFPTIHPFVNGDLNEEAKAEIARRKELAQMAGDKPWVMLPDNGGGINAWFRDGNNFIPERWVQVMAATQRQYGKKMESVEPFNEPDFDLAQGNARNLWDMLGVLKQSSDFKGVKLAGPSLLNADLSPKGYEVLGGRLDIATTHALAGSMKNYIKFIEEAVEGGTAVQNPEVHNLGEVISGAEYGMESAIWWGTADLARGEFVKASNGVRLAYAEDRDRWTCAAVYRTTDGKIQAFAGGSERIAATTSYRFVATDRDVFFDGQGPQREYTVTIPGGLGYQSGQPSAEHVVHITWGEDVPPALKGRYVIVNRASGKVLDVDQASKDNGGKIQQWAYTSAAHQQWDVAPLVAHGDQSYFTIRAVHSGKALDTANRNYDEGGPIQQWGQGEADAQQWYFEYAGNNDFYIRSRWSTKCLGIAEENRNDGLPVQQFSKADKPALKWRLVPVETIVKSQLDFESPAAPTGLTATAKSAGVELSWNANSDADIFSYTIFRSDTRTGPYDTIAREVTGTTFTDTKPVGPGMYFYRVKAVDRSLNQSEFCQEASTTK